jgi:hypothetical protein
MDQLQAELALVNEHLQQVNAQIAERQQSAEHLGASLIELVSAKRELWTLRERAEELTTARDLLAARLAKQTAQSA